MLKFTKVLLALAIIGLIGYSIYGISVVSANDQYEIVWMHDHDTMECYNYSMLKDQMFDLQSKRIYSKGLKRKVIERKINKLRPSVINREVLCLGRGVTPN